MEKIKKCRPVFCRTIGFSILICAIAYQWNGDRKLEEDVQQISDDCITEWTLQADAQLEQMSVPETSETASEASAATKSLYDGSIDCILEIPAIDLRRVVITGGDREKNLSNHFFVAAREEMAYGTGSYVIFGHQSFTKNMGFNRLDELHCGDVIYIITKNKKTAYSVTEIVSSQWDEAAGDFSDDKRCLAIYTCKKQTERPKPYMVVRAVKNP